MKKLLFITMLAVLPLAVQAQTRFGYFSYDSLFHAMPEYAYAEQTLATLRAKYDEEMKRSEEEFNAKYEEFLEEQRDLVPSILRKRQTELQEIMDKNVEFKQEARRLLEAARKDAYAPIRAKIAAAVTKVGLEQGLAFILNTDGDACPYVDPTIGVDVTPALHAALNIH